MSPGKDIQIQTASQRGQDLVHVREHERIFFHIRPAHMLRQTGAGRLLVDEVVDRLNSVADGQISVFE